MSGRTGRTIPLSTLLSLVGLINEGADTVYTISKDVEVIPTFDAMGLNPDLLRGIYAYGRSLIVIPTPIGFEKPSAIQQRAILPIIKGTT